MSVTTVFAMQFIYTFLKKKIIGNSRYCEYRLDYTVSFCVDAYTVFTQEQQEPVHHSQWGVWSREDRVCSLRYEILCNGQQI